PSGPARPPGGRSPAAAWWSAGGGWWSWADPPAAPARLARRCCGTRQSIRAISGRGSATEPDRQPAGRWQPRVFCRVSRERG
ncbi:hypothetical protein WAI89_21165, partial [Acinetobacter baumannii]